MNTRRKLGQANTKRDFSLLRLRTSVSHPFGRRSVNDIAVDERKIILFFSQMNIYIKLILNGFELPILIPRVKYFPKCTIYHIIIMSNLWTRHVFREIIYDENAFP